MSVPTEVNTPSKTCIRTIFQRFCGTGIVENRSYSGRHRSITEEKVNEVKGTCENEPKSSVQSMRDFLLELLNKLYLVWL
jgi:hypothetical protein